MSLALYSLCTFLPLPTLFVQNVKTYVCRLFSQNGQVNEERSFTLSNMLDAVSPIGKDSAWMDEALRGLLEQPMQNLDSSFTPEVTNKLFRYVCIFDF